jgi:hypothetical protein
MYNGEKLSSSMPTNTVSAAPHFVRCLDDMRACIESNREMTSQIFDRLRGIHNPQDEMLKEYEGEMQIKSNAPEGSFISQLDGNLEVLRSNNRILRVCLDHLKTLMS